LGIQQPASFIQWSKPIVKSSEPAHAGKPDTEDHMAHPVAAQFFTAGQMLV
jgi:hypothetical protein